MSETDTGVLPFDRPNSYIGRSVPRPNARRLLEGRGRFVDDIELPRMLHAVFVRSPFAHARIGSIDLEAAKASPGVVAIFTGRDLESRIEPWVGVLTHFAGLRSAPQTALASDVARWQGEPVAMVVARSRAEAEDAASLVDIDYEPLTPVTSVEAALAEGAPRIHEAFDSNLAWERLLDIGDVDAAFAAPDATVVERSFTFQRHTGVTLEPRTAIFDYDPSENRLTFHYSGQAPHMMQALLGKAFGIPEANVRVVARDVGGSFGIKIHTYGDEIATAAAAILLKRPVKFVADRLESFQSDIHARSHIVKAKMAVSREGRITALAFDDVTGIGPFSVYPRSSAVEANQVVNLTGSPYRIDNYRARARVVFQNKAPMCQYRAVGHPIAMTVAEGLVDDAAAALGLDRFELRRRNLVTDDGYPKTSAVGLKFDGLSHEAALAKTLQIMDHGALLADQAEARSRGVYRGIGLAVMVEVTNPSPLFYGVGGAPISAQDGATVRLDPSGAVTLAASVTEQGQGTEAVLAQIAAASLGVDIADVRVITGDTEMVPYGGGTWASRGAGIGGEATLQAALALKAQILEAAGPLLQTDPASLDIAGGAVVDASGEARLPLADLARTIYYRGHELPSGTRTELVATRHFKVEDYPFVFTNGVNASYVEVEVETGLVKLLGHWVVEDCGRVINPKLVDEQVRGGVVQGIGGALYEECLYSDDGQLLNASMADYLVPMAAEMPDIVVAHIETPTLTSVLGAKGAGEAGTGGAPAAVMNAVNDALRPLGAQVSTQPMTPKRILAALGKLE